MAGTTAQSILDQIAAEVDQLTDEEIAKAAANIQARKEAAKLRMSPDRVQKMKDAEKKRRLLAKAIMQRAKEKGLVEQVKAEQASA